MSRRTKGRRIAVAVTVLALAGAGAAAAFLYADRGGDAATADDGLPPATTEVTRQTLTDVETVDGELGYGTPTTALGRTPGTITYLPESGAEIGRGEALYKVDDEPVTLMYGGMPAYRDLAIGTEGPDVEQLEKNLDKLGYDGFTVDDEYTASTAEAVREWQEDKGYEETGTVRLGQVVFADAAVRVDALQAAEGAPVTPGQGVLSYTRTEKAVTVSLDPSDQRLAEVDAAVEVELPDGSTVDGKVEEVTTVIEPATGQDAEPTTSIEVTVAFDDQKAADSYAMAAVDVSFTADEREDVLTVPVGALLALQEGGFGVEVVEGASTRYVAVDTGLFANGRVEISGEGVTEGTVVGMPA